MPTHEKPMPRDEQLIFIIVMILLAIVCFPLALYVKIKEWVKRR